MTLQKIPGFESTAYAYQGGRVVWAGLHSVTDHPRNAWTPWQPPQHARTLNAGRLQAGAATCLSLFGPHTANPLQDDLCPQQAPPIWMGETAPGQLEPKGLLLWLTGKALVFPLNLAVPRFDAVRQALLQHDLPAFAASAKRLLGLGHGLTPSGDDFVGGIMFTLAHLRQVSPAQEWLVGLPQLAHQLNQAAAASTNVISAALFEDLLAGISYSVLHALLAALDTQDGTAIQSATADLLALGASSGADLLAGILLALAALPSPKPPNLSTASCSAHPHSTRH